MKVLILHQHFKTPGTGGAIRSYYLAKGLLDHGHTPVVITGHNEKKYLHTTVDGIEVHYLPVPYDNSFDYFRRSVSFIRFVMQSIRIAGTIPDLDRVYAISVPLTIAIVARWISSKRNIPYVFEVGDLWPDAPIQLGFIRNPLMKAYLYRMERRAYEGAETVVALSPSIASAIVKKVPQARVVVTPNMSDCNFYKPSDKPAEVPSKLGPVARATGGKLVVSYIGAVGYANGLDYFLECANTSRKADLPIHFVICGTGAHLERLKENVKRMNLQNITFTGFVDRDGVKEVMDISDAVFVCYKNVPILETGSPNKFFDGLAAGKLIVVNFGGWIAKEIMENRCGVQVNPTDPTDFIRKIRVFTTDAELLKQYQQAARSLAESKYDRKMLVDQWVHAIVR